MTHRRFFLVIHFLFCFCFVTLHYLLFTIGVGFSKLLLHIFASYLCLVSIFFSSSILFCFHLPDMLSNNACVFLFSLTLYFQSMGTSWELVNKTWNLSRDCFFLYSYWKIISFSILQKNGMLKRKKTVWWKVGFFLLVRRKSSKKLSAKQWLHCLIEAFVESQ